MAGKLEQGLVQIYTGEGKGKTTAALGLALRALGRDLKVYMLQFLKGEDTGELHAGRLFGDKFVIQQTGLKGFIHRGKVDPADVLQAREALKTGQGNSQPAASTIWLSWTKSLWPCILN